MNADELIDALAANEAELAEWELLARAEPPEWLRARAWREFWCPNTDPREKGLGWGVDLWDDEP